MTKKIKTSVQPDFMDLFRECRLCPRNCGVNRVGGTEDFSAGFCGRDHVLTIAHIGAHFGEEPPITGTRGSGTVFFTGCSLKCSFCQNYQISREGMGKPLSMDELFSKVTEMINEKGVHNINFVTPDHYFPYVCRLISRLREKGYHLPSVFNLSGYQSTQMLGMATDYADIYLPDFKYSDPAVSMELSKCGDYPEKALKAIMEMVKQKGFLDSFTPGQATQGVLVRHLILPARIENSLNALTTLFLEFGADLPVSLMSQYYPVIKHKDRDLNRTISREEFDRVYSHALDLGFNNLFVQFPDGQSGLSRTRPPFVPDFGMQRPFPENS